MSSPPPPSKYHKWIVAAVATSGTFMAVLDTTIVDIALPKMMSTFECDLYRIQWVLISYFLGSVISMCCVGWVTNHVGSRNAFLGGLAVFTALSVTCGMAPDLEIMNISRFLQGVGEGFVIPTALIILYETFPAKERGIAMGFYGLGILFAPAIGPSLGGFITEHLSWRWIFYVNIPIGAAGLIVGWLRLARTQREGRMLVFDWPGFLLMTVSLSALVLITTQGQEKGWLQSDYILTLGVIFVTTFPLFILWEIYTPAPLLDLRVFFDRNFTLCVVIACLSVFATYGIWILLPVYMERLREIPTFTAGLILLPGSVASAAVIMGSGALSDRWDPRAVLGLTVIGAAAASFLYTTDLVVSKRQIALEYGIWMSLIAAQYPPLNSLNLSNLPEKLLNMGSTVFNVARMLLASIGTAYATTMLQAKRAAFYTVLSAKATYAEPAARAFVAKQLQTRGGVPDASTLGTIKAVVGQYITANAAAYSFESVFEILGVWMALCLPFVFFLKKAKRVEHLMTH